MKQLLSLFFLFLFGPILLGQSNNLYDINVELIQEDKLLIINQILYKIWNKRKYRININMILNRTIINFLYIVPTGWYE